MTDAQADQIREARTAHRRSEIERDAAIEVAELDLEDLMHDEASADLAAVEAKMLEIARLRVDGRIAGLRLHQQVMGVLTDEQREQLDEMGGFRIAIRGRGGEPTELRLRRGPEGRFFFRDGEGGFGLHLDDEAFDLAGSEWRGRLFEALEPLRNLEFWFDGEHEEHGEEAEGEQEEGTSGVSRGSDGTRIAPIV